MTEVKRKMKTMTVWKRVLWILLVMLLIRIGTVVPIPFVNKEYMKSVLGSLGGSIWSALLGGSMSQMSLFALSISPYITASIVIQMMTVVIPALEEMQRDGKVGQDRYKKVITITGIVFSLFQAVLMAWGLGSRGLIDPYNIYTVILATIIWTLGAVILIAVGEFLDNFQLGSGISMILFCNIVSSVPSDIAKLYEMFIQNNTVAYKVLYGAVIILIFAAAIYLATALMTAVKNVPVKMSGKIAGSCPSQDIPIPLATCGVMPYIFAVSVLAIPSILTTFIPALNDGVLGKITASLLSSNWFLINHPVRSLGAVVFIVLTYFFTLFYINFSFNPKEMAENLRRQGAFIAGVRPGEPTEKRLSNIIHHVALWGNGLMIALVLVITAICNISGVGTLSLSGTSLIIAVSVLNDFCTHVTGEMKTESGSGRRATRSVFGKERKAV